MNHRQFDDPQFTLQNFAEKMLEELKYHDDENTRKFVNVSIDELVSLLGTEMVNRFVKIYQANEDWNHERIQKQAIHLANYCYFVAAKAAHSIHEEKERLLD